MAEAALEAADLIDRGEVLIAGMAAMLITIFLGPRFIEYLRVKEFGQHIREEGPQEHHAKAGTPTMGGLIIFVGISVPFLVLSERDTESLAVFAVALGCAGIGLADDWIKISKRRSLGLSARYKLLAQILLAVALFYVGTEEIGLETTIQSRVFGGEIDIPAALYVVFIFLVIAGASNAVNLTDGLDGLAAGSCGIVFLAFTRSRSPRGQEGLAILSACFVGAFDRLSVVQRVPCLDLHGRHRLFGARRRDRRARRHDADGAPPDHPGRDLRHRGPLGRDPGRVVQADAPPRLLDGAGAPPLRAPCLVGDEDHAALLDRSRQCARGSATRCSRTQSASPPSPRQGVSQAWRT